MLGLAQVAESVRQRDRFLGRVLIWTVFTMATASRKCRCHRETTPHHRFPWKLPYRPLSVALKGELQERHVMCVAALRTNANLQDLTHARTMVSTNSRNWEVNSTLCLSVPETTWRSLQSLLGLYKLLLLLRKIGKRLLQLGFWYCCHEGQGAFCQKRASSWYAFCRLPR